MRLYEIGIELTLSTKMNYRKEISKEEIAILPHGKYTGNIHLINDKQEADSALEELMYSKIIGIDTETKPAFKRGQSFPVSLVQLASEKKVYLFRTLSTGPLPLLKELLEEESIVKVGIAIHDDLKDLSKSLSHSSRNIIDLNQFAQEHGFVSIGARKLAALVLNIRISKAQQVSNWENPVLSKAQIDYAATDAWLCREVYLRLIGR
jgi:ribonuclease D